MWYHRHMAGPGSVNALADIAVYEIERVAWTPNQRDLFQRIEAHPFERADHALDFTGRLARDRGWSLDFARGAVAEYRRFCFLAMLFDIPRHSQRGGRRGLAPAPDLFPRLLGGLVWQGAQQPLHHDPTEGGPSEQGRYRMQCQGGTRAAPG